MFIIFVQKGSPPRKRMPHEGYITLTVVPKKEKCLFAVKSNYKWRLTTIMLVETVLSLGSSRLSEREHTTILLNPHLKAIKVAPI